MAFNNSSLLTFAVVIILAIGYAVLTRPKRGAKLYSTVPSVGVKEGWFQGLRTQLATLGDLRLMMGPGYEEFGKSSRPFILPEFGPGNRMIMLPQTQVKWIVDQPDGVLNAKSAQKRSLQTDRTLLDDTIVDRGVHELIIKRDLTRQLGTLIPEIEDELHEGISKYWGTDTEDWREVCVYETMMKIVSRTSNRIFVGAELCRNDEYLRNAGAFSQDIAISASMIRLLPEIVKPFVAWIFLLPNRWHHYKCAKHLVPLIRQRMKDMENVEKSKAPNDFTTWLIKETATDPNPKDRTPEKIALIIMSLNFAAIHTSTFAASNALFDIYGSATAASDVQELREEIEQVYAECEGKWDKNAVAKLVKTDSALRESLRISTFMIQGLARMVVAPEGVTDPNGLFIPQGTRLGTPAYNIHHDESFYENAGTYTPFRYSQARGALSQSGIKPGTTTEAIPNGDEKNAAGGRDGGMEKEKENLAKVLQAKNLSTVTTSETFLSFGHGKHACPGRFFAVTEIKLLLAYIILNYDIKILEKRPPNLSMAGAILPPMKSNLTIKRRNI